MRKVVNVEKFAKDEKDRLKIVANTRVDRDGRWTIRSDSRLIGYDIVFAGAGDTYDPMTIGGGKEFRFDFFDSNQLLSNSLTGFKQIRIDYMFNDDIYLKEGTVFFFNAPKGSYMDFYWICPTGGIYDKKIYGADATIPNPTVAEVDTIVGHIVIKYFVEGSCPMGDELNTEACTDDPIPKYIIWRTEITVPEVGGWENFHGHWNFELYRPASVYFAE